MTFSLHGLEIQHIMVHIISICILVGLYEGIVLINKLKRGDSPGICNHRSLIIDISQNDGDVST